MSINLIRFIQLQRQRAQRLELDKLRYRGVEYKKWSVKAGGRVQTPALLLA